VRTLRGHLPPPSWPGVLVGDMNFWGPPVSLALPGWRRAVRARSYPSWRAHSQIDHILVTRAVKVLSGESVAVGRSDHLPLRARLSFPS
jgi:endonuclease/exonuclease/phosphatase family metal-dependent hydrolase